MQKNKFFAPVLILVAIVSILAPLKTMNTNAAPVNNVDMAPFVEKCLRLGFVTSPMVLDEAKCQAFANDYTAKKEQYERSRQKPQDPPRTDTPVPTAINTGTPTATRTNTPTATPIPWTGYTPPSNWACNRVFTSNDFTQTFDPNYEFVQYLQSHGWGTFYELNQMGISNETQLQNLFATYGPLGQGDLVYIRVDFSGWSTEVSAARIAELNAAKAAGAIVVIETEYAAFGSYDPYPNTLFSQLGSNIQKDMMRNYVTSEEPYLVDSWNYNFWFTTSAWDETIGSGGSVYLATSNLLGTNGLYFSQEGYHYALMAESNNLRVNGDTSNTNDDAYWYYSDYNWRQLKHQAMLMSCATQTGGPIDPPPTVTPSATPTANNTPTASRTPTQTGTPTNTRTATATQTATATRTASATFTPGVCPTSTPSFGGGGCVSPTPTITLTPSDTPTASNTPTASETPTPTETVTNTATATPTVTPTNTPGGPTGIEVATAEVRSTNNNWFIYALIAVLALGLIIWRRASR